MRLGIVGCGVIGEATAKVLEDQGQRVSRHDPAKGLVCREHFDAAFICVPTPLGPDGKLDTAYVWGAVEETDADIIVVRSTLPLGTCERLPGTVVYMPCFARERQAYLDEKRAAYRVYGGDRGVKVASLFPCQGRVLLTDYRTAEMTKLAMNAFLAMSVSFASEMADAAEDWGADWKQVKNLMRADWRIGPGAYLEPGVWGGKCFPKDLANLLTQTNSDMVRATIRTNERVTV